MNKKWIFFVTIVVLILVLSLSSLNAARNLKFKIVKIAFKDVEFTGATLDLMVNASNPSLIPVYFTSITFKVFINEQYLGSGGSETLYINGRDSKIIPMNFTVSYANISPIIRDMMRKGGQATLKIDGQAYFFLFNIPFTNSTTTKF